MSTKEFGCFFCDGKSHENSGLCPECGRSINVGDALQGTDLGNLKVNRVIGRGFYGWTLEAWDGLQQFAVKVVPMFRLLKKEDFDQEAQSLAQCSRHPNIVRLIARTVRTIALLGEKIEVLVLQFDYIPDANPLRRILEDSTLLLTRTDTYGILAGIASGLDRLHGRGLWHDDLHDDNILVRQLAEDEIGEGRYETMLIDFGSCKRVMPDTPESKERSDYFYFSKHVSNLALHFEIVNRRKLTPADRFFCERLRRISQQLADLNVSRRNLSPRQLKQDLRRALDESSSGALFPSFEDMVRTRNVSFRDPFANTNALYLAPQDISLLFRDSLGWAGRITKSEPVLVVGPRGCGKTMLLRFSSIEAQARPRPGENEPKAVKERLARESHIGFLVSVSKLRTPFLRTAYKRLEVISQDLSEEFAREYINAHFAFEVLRTVLWLRNECLADISDDDIALIVGVVTQVIPVGRTLSTGGMALEQAIEVLEERVRSMSSLRKPKDYQPVGLSGDDVLVRLASALRQTSWAAEKEIWFLLDDYSKSMLPSLAIKAFNPVLFRPSSELKMKVSSEGDGPPFEDTLKRKYKEGRELSRINLGEVYFQSTEERGREFFEEILEARFFETGPKYTLAKVKEVLGEHKHFSNFGPYIKSVSRAGDARFHGFGLLCCLCSGDVSFILELLDKLVKFGEHKGRPLRAAEQDKIIKHFARGQLFDLRSISDHGPQLYGFANALGSVLREYLLTSDDGKDQRLRIEVEGSGELLPMEAELHDALLRHSVLIPGGGGKSMSGQPTRLLYFRRLYAPCFPFSPLRKGCIALTVPEFAEWLRDPSTIRRDPKRKKATKSRTKANQDELGL